MEITGKVLREVEFRDRLRGYDTDEVDEFLEEVAVAVDELHRRLAAAATGRSPAASPSVEPRERSVEPTIDDDSIRRTLVLAQRTADLAIKEANEEAVRIVDLARREAQELVSQATENVRRMRDEADAEFSNRVSAQLSQREQLEHDVQMLNSLVLTERNRLTEALQTILQYVDENLSVSTEVKARADTPALVNTAAESPTPVPEIVVENEITERSAEPLVDRPDDIDEGPRPSTAPRPIEPAAAPLTPGDQDEELWQRWANGGGFDDDEARDENDPFGFNRGS